VVVDFENEAPLTPDPTNVGTSYTNGDITFGSLDGNDLFLVQTGLPTNGFVPNDNVASPGDFGDVFLTGDFQRESAVGLTFVEDLLEITFEVADIDGGGGQQEIFTFEFLNDGSVVNSQVFASGDANTGDAVVTTVSYTGLIDEVKITNTTFNPNSNRNIGWGIDNIAISAVPVPLPAVLLLSALVGGAAAYRRRKTA